MIPYTAPLTEIRFALDAIGRLPEIAALPGYEHTAPDLVDAVLEEAGKFASGVFAPLNRVGDIQGSRLENGAVRTPDGFATAYQAHAKGGWGGLAFPEAYGGQGLPLLVAVAVAEMGHAANMALALCPMLTQGAMELLETHGTPEQKATYLPKFVSGEWTGTMNLTEPQAGSDLGALRTRAIPDGDGRWRLHGQKIFVSWGDHDLTANIIHLVLARTPNAAPGSRGISLFLVPTFLPRADGSPGERNDIRTVGIEHKLGIRASPTCTLSYGDKAGALGFMVGPEGGGLACMFTMMNNARLQVGLEGVAIGERALQQARLFARGRVQGRAPGAAEPGPILCHPDVRRMLLLMRARTEESRALAYHAAACLDRARRSPDAAARARWQGQADLLTPVVKAWCTDGGVEVASLGVQVHGGAGFIEETGAAQHLRDARIAPIYEGTNGIQAADLAGRKLLRDGGVALGDLIAQIRAEMPGGSADAEAIAAPLAAGVAAVEAAAAWLSDRARDDPAAAAGGATPFLQMVGLVAGGWLMARGATAAASRIAEAGADTAFLHGKIQVARFYAEQILSAAPSLLAAVQGGVTLMAIDPGTI
jgi:alkylation response protein AidB-like acyl-CoA dehydrogenase